MYSKDELVLAMREKKLKSSEVAGLLDITPGTFSKKLNGRIEFSIKEVEDLIEIFGIKKVQTIFFKKDVA